MRNRLAFIANQSFRRERNDSLIIEKMQEFIVAIEVKTKVWTDLKTILDDSAGEVTMLLDQNIPIVQV
jgi:hypothetical protein